MLDKRAASMTKEERIQAARDEFHRVDEYSPGAATQALAIKWDISTSEAAVIVNEPARLIAKARQRDLRQAARGESCHYCGQPAVSLNWFDVPVCRECNG